MIQFVIGSFVQPRVQGHALDLHPVVIVLALIFFGMIWGVMGAFLATPDHRGGAYRFRENPHHASAGPDAGRQSGRALGRAVERISIRSAAKGDSPRISIKMACGFQSARAY